MFNEVILHRLFLEAFRCSFNFSFALMANLQGTLFSTELAASANSVTDLLGSKFRKCEMNEGKEGVRLRRGQSQFARPKKENCETL